MIRLAAAALLLGACGDNVPPPPPGPEPEPAFVDVALPPERELDVLYVMGAGCCIQEEEAQLRAALAALLETLPGDGALPDLHVGAISSHLGLLGHPGASEGCAGFGLEGHLQHQWCDLVSGTFLFDVDDGAGGRSTNYTGSLNQAMGCIMNLDDGPCGIDSTLEAVRRALDDEDGYNAGFLRDTAQLAILFLLDDDDCSAIDNTVWGPETPELGPLTSFRCFEFGVICDEPDPRAEGPHTNCHPRDSSQYMQRIQHYVDHLVNLRPGRVSIHAIHGPPNVVVGRRLPMGQTRPQPSLESSCMGESFAWPAIRLEAFVRAFDDHGASSSACAEGYSAPITAFGERLRDRLIGQPCLRKALWDSNPLTDEIEHQCEMELTGIGHAPMPLAECDADASNAPCWRLVADAACGTAPADLRVEAVGLEPVQGRHVQGRCQVVP